MNVSANELSIGITKLSGSHPFRKVSVAIKKARITTEKTDRTLVRYIKPANLNAFIKDVPLKNETKE